MRYFLIEPLVRAALLEDIAHGGDLTTDAIVDAQSGQPPRWSRARRDIFGHGARAWLSPARPRRRVHRLVADGEPCRGRRTRRDDFGARRALTGERTALNFLCRLFGHCDGNACARRFDRELTRTSVDTRKTTPGLRALEKAAVVAGGGHNHRFGLDDAVLIKDNHIALAAGISAAVTAVRERVGHMVKVEVEVDTLDQLREALELPIDAVLLDNMSDAQLREAVELAGGRVLTEASGSIDAERIAAGRRTGVDLISVGWITHSAPALDLGLDLCI